MTETKLLLHRPNFRTCLDPNGALHSLLMMQQSIQLAKEGGMKTEDLIESRAPVIAVLEALGMDVDLNSIAPLLQLWEERYLKTNNPEAFIAVAAQLIAHQNETNRRAAILN